MGLHMCFKVCVVNVFRELACAHGADGAVVTLDVVLEHMCGVVDRERHAAQRADFLWLTISI